MEKRSGADLYISLVRFDGGQPVSKGMLVQSKWDYALRHGSERRVLRDQSRPRRTIGELVAGGLRCTVGDRAIGRNLDHRL
jgi:hypothetical protein